MRISDWSSDVCSSDLLSFPLVQQDLLEVQSNGDDGEILLGDIVLARSVCINEAAERNISVADHAAHLIVHGTFHLMGYDHMEDADDEALEALEISAHRSFGISALYGYRSGRKTQNWRTHVDTTARKPRQEPKADAKDGEN